MNTWFYNRYGEAQIILSARGMFFDKQGNNLGYVHNSTLIYNFMGQHCGWIEGNVIRDLSGFVVGFARNANDFPSPLFPIPQLPPLPPLQHLPPLPRLRALPSLKPLKQFGWSHHTLITLFK